MRDYQTKSNQGALPDSNAATKYGAGEVNSLRTEAKTAVQRAGLTLAPQDGTGEETDQLAQAQFINGVAAQHMQDGGAQNAIVLTPVTGATGLTLPPDYTTLNGAHFTFFAAFDNNGATTVSIGQTGGTQIGVLDLVREDGSALVGSEITTAIETRIFYDLSNNRFVLVGGAFQNSGGDTNFATKDEFDALALEVSTLEGSRWRGVTSVYDGFEDGSGIDLGESSNITRITTGAYVINADVTEATFFDGSTNTVADAIDTIPDGNQICGSFWFRLTGADNTEQVVIDNSNFFCRVNRLPSNKLQAGGYDSSQNNPTYVRSLPSFTADGLWHHCCFTVDAPGNNLQMYVDDVDVKDGPNSVRNTNTWDMTRGAAWRAGVDWTGDLAELWFDNNVALDMSVEADRRKFIDANGRPVDLGSNGQLPTGTSPAFYFRGDSSTFATNQGTSGGWGLNVGALQDGLPIPGDPAIGTMVAVPITADAVPDAANVTIQFKGNEAVTENTDFSVSATRNGTTDWVGGTLVQVGTVTNDGVIQFKATDIDLSGTPAGTDVNVKVDFLTAKDMELHALGNDWEE